MITSAPMSLPISTAVLCRHVGTAGTACSCKISRRWIPFHNLNPGFSRQHAGQSSGKVHGAGLATGNTKDPNQPRLLNSNTATEISLALTPVDNPKNEDKCKQKQRVSHHRNSFRVGKLLPAKGMALTKFLLAKKTLLLSFPAHRQRSPRTK